MGNLFKKDIDIQKMPKRYSREPPVSKNAVKACGKDLRVHFKNTYNVARAVKGMGLKQAQKYLTDVLNHTRCIPMRRFAGSTGRTAQAKEWGLTMGRWPTKSVKIVMGLLENMLANANTKQLEVDNLVINHVQVQAAQKGRRRTYRAHGRITPYMSNPCHVEMWASLKAADVAKEKKRSDMSALSKVQAARARTRSKLAVGEN